MGSGRAGPHPPREAWGDGRRKTDEVLAKSGGPCKHLVAEQVECGTDRPVPAKAVVGFRRNREMLMRDNESVLEVIIGVWGRGHATTR